MTTPRISVVLVTRNGADTLPRLLDALWSQRTATPIEIIAVDSGSTDGTAALLASRVDVFVPIDSRDFDHGLTRNLGISRARGEFVVLLVQDALPVSDTWLDELTRPFVDDQRLAGTFARQTPRADASALTRHYLQQWAASASVGWTSRLPAGAHQFRALVPIERLLRCTFDNVASCIRRSVWEQHPFRSTPIAEDLEWARDVLLAGYAIAFVPEAVVVHSHDRTARHEFIRTQAVHDRLYDLFGLQTIPTRLALARAVLSCMALHIRCEWRTPSRWPRALALAVAWPLGQYLGARRARSREARAGATASGLR